MSFRVASFSSTSSLINSNMRIQSNLADTQTQLSTGLKSTSFEGISRDTQKLLSLESSTTAMTNYNVNGNVANSYINIMYSSLQSMVDLSNNFMTTLTAAQGGSQVDPQVTKDQAQLLANEFQGLLNTSSAGRYLFGGSKIDVAPVNLAATPAQTSPSAADTSYYQGDDKTAKVQINSSLVVDYGVTADNPAFEKAFRAFNLAANNPTDKTALAEASNLMKGAIDGMANVMGRLSTNSRTVENEMQRNEEDMTVIGDISSSIKNVDMAAASVRQAELQSQLEAAYASSVKLLKLSILNYI